MNKYLKKCYNKLKEYETYDFENGLQQFLFYYHLSSKVTKIGNDNVHFDSRSVIDFFVYKFSDPFIENKGLANEGHITNGFIGQQIRYIALRQTDYEYNGKTIKRPTHLVWRDAHANCPGYNDYLWIEKINEISKSSKTELYLIPTSIAYMPE
jgi:hypothetical protein